MIDTLLGRNIPFMVIIGEEETVNQSEPASKLQSKGVIPVGCEFCSWK